MAHPVPEEVHGRAAAAKAHDHQVGGHAHGGKCVEFPRRVENNLPLVQLAAVVAGDDPHHALIHVQQLPEIVAFAGIGVAARIFKVVHGIELAHRDGTGRGEGAVV